MRPEPGHQIVRSSAQDMLGLEGNGRGGRRDAQKDLSQIQQWTAVTTWLEWMAEDIGLWGVGGIKVLHRVPRVPRGVANGELIKLKNGGLRQN